MNDVLDRIENNQTGGGVTLDRCIKINLESIEKSKFSKLMKIRKTKSRKLNRQEN